MAFRDLARRFGWLLPSLAFVTLSIDARADRYEDAERTVVRLPPHLMPILPPRVAAHFEALGCTVPQPFPDPRRPLTMQNAMRGSFVRRGQVDYAILCSTGGHSRIEIFWGGPASCPDLESSVEDLVYMQGIDEQGSIGYSRGIDPIAQRGMAYDRRWLGGPRPRDSAHAGIEDSYIGKGSVVHYCSGGRWQPLTGMD